MKTGYNSRQNKIYEDYKGYSSERLLEMFKNPDKYIPAVIEIISIILKERDAFPKFYLQDMNAKLAREKEEKEKQGKEDSADKLARENEKKQLKLKSLVKKSEQYSDKELSGIITRYLNYEREAVEAALIISERRHIITSTERNTLVLQIEKGYRDGQIHVNRVKKERKKISRVQVIFGIILVAIGAILTLTGVRLNFFGVPVLHYGTIVLGIWLILNALF